MHKLISRKILSFQVICNKELYCPHIAEYNLHFLLKLLVCLRMLMRRCVYENISKDAIQKLFPNEVLPEYQRLLTLLLQKFQREWREDVQKDQVIYFAMGWVITLMSSKINGLSVCFCCKSCSG